MPSPFCDRLTVSVPKSHDAALKDVLEEFAIVLDAVPDRVPGKWNLRSGGSFFYSRRKNWAALEASGRALADLRAKRVFGDYLQALGAMPWRVTRLDAALDLPQRAAPFLHDLYGRASKGAVSLGRKAIKGVEVVSYLSRPLYDGEPLDTGTVYVPSRKFGLKRQYATAYDKRQERIARGCPTLGHCCALRLSPHVKRARPSRMPGNPRRSSMTSCRPISCLGLTVCRTGLHRTAPGLAGQSPPPRPSNGSTATLRVRPAGNCWSWPTSLTALLLSANGSTGSSAGKLAATGVAT